MSGGIAYVWDAERAISSVELQSGHRRARASRRRAEDLAELRESDRAAPRVHRLDGRREDPRRSGREITRSSSKSCRPITSACSASEAQARRGNRADAARCAAVASSESLTSCTWVNHRFQRVSAQSGAVPRSAASGSGFRRDLHAARRGAPATARRALHGLRRAVLPERSRLPDRQPDSRVERPGLSGPLARRARSAAQDEQLPRVHRPHLPRAVRRRVRARHHRSRR